MCLHVYICIYIHLCIYLHVCVFVHIDSCACTHIVIHPVCTMYFDTFVHSKMHAFTDLIPMRVTADSRILVPQCV